MQTKNFLPGMNPFLQVRWPDAHTRLITYIGDALNAQLPSDLSVIAEESITIDSLESDPDDDARVRPDVSLVESPSIRLPQPVVGDQGTSLVTLARPATVRVSTTRRWLEIRDTFHHLVTVIELLNPSNKTPAGSLNMARRNERLLNRGVNIVEIDLIRGGFRTLPELIENELNSPEGQTTYMVVIGHAHVLHERQVYYCPLRERLPAFAVPLRSTDAPVPLDLQPLIDRCYEAGRYWQVSQRPLPPPALPSDEQTWLNQQLRAADLLN